MLQGALIFLQELYDMNRACLLRSNVRGHTKRLHTLSEGTMIGELGINAGRRTVTVQASTELVELAEMDSYAFGLSPFDAETLLLRCVFNQSSQIVFKAASNLPDWLRLCVLAWTD